MLKFYKRFNREFLFLGALSVFSISLVVFRTIYSGSYFYLFLIWNLFLAFIPWGLSHYALTKPWLRKNKIVLAVIVFVWLVFFPNAPYILTDLMHLRDSYSVPVWYDILLILFFAWTGLLFGFFSFWNIQKILLTVVKLKYIDLVSSAILFLGGFGIYIGRYLRWNTWDIVCQPVGLFSDISTRILNPFEYANTWAMTFLMGIFLNVLYWSFRLIQTNSLKQ